MKEIERDKNYQQTLIKQKMKTVKPLKRKQWQGGKRKVGMQKRKRK